MPPSRSSKAFTLIETALALGIIAVSLTAILGVLGTGMSTSRTNDSESTLVSMSEEVLAQLRLARFDALWLHDPATASQQPGGTLVTAGPPADSIYHFSSEGRQLTGSERMGEAFYVCTVKKEAVAGMVSATGSECHLLKLRLVFQWPAAAAESQRTTRVISTRIARR